MIFTVPLGTTLFLTSSMKFKSEIKIVPEESALLSIILSFWSSKNLISKIYLASSLEVILFMP